MSLEIVNARSEPMIGGPPPSLQQSTRYKRTADREAKQEAFFRAYEKHGTITHSAREAGIDPSYHYKWLEIDDTYPERFQAAHRCAVEALEREARRRAVEGVEEPTGWYQGQPGGFVKRYSDTLLIFLLKGALPDKYKDRHEHTGKNGGPIEVQSTVTIEQFPVWLKQAIVVVSSGVQIDPEVERMLQSHFEMKFLEAEKLVGSGDTDRQSSLSPVEMVSESVVEVEVESDLELEPVMNQPLATQPIEPEPRQDWRPAKKVSLDIEDI